MLLALLYDDTGRLAAAAPACDQQPLGDRYWREVNSEGVSLRGSETAYVDIDDRWLVDRLLRMDFAYDTSATEAVDEYLGLARPGGINLPD
jgi:hypothetical protein